MVAVSGAATTREACKKVVKKNSAEMDVPVDNFKRFYSPLKCKAHT